MANYTQATQTRTETTFSNMLRTDGTDDVRFHRLYQLVTWTLYPGAHYKVRRAKATEFFTRLAEYARQQEHS